jgi:hypothetical protein
VVLTVNGVELGRVRKDFGTVNDLPYQIDEFIFNVPVSQHVTNIGIWLLSVQPLHAGTYRCRVKVTSLELAVDGGDAIPPSPPCSSPFLCSPDPAQSFDFVIRYTNSRGLQREFRQTFDNNTLYQTNADTTGWDSLSSLDHGIRTSPARWEQTTFILDTIDGKGLDQCTIPGIFTTIGQGTLNFHTLSLHGAGQEVGGCAAKVDIVEDTAGKSVDETQAVTLPKPVGGTWTLSFDYAGLTTTTAAMAWDANKTAVKFALAALPNIGSLDNLRVLGTGTTLNPFLITFINQLGGRDLHLLRGDGGNLQISIWANVTKVVEGTLNERQLIQKTAGVTADLLLSFAGWQSEPIPANASINQMEAALNRLHSINGSVRVLGQIADRDAPYDGPWFVDFINELADADVPPMIAQTEGYTISTRWQGGRGIDDTQEVAINATSGTFALLIPSGDVTDATTVRTGPIPADATADQVAVAILLVAPWFIPGGIDHPTGKPVNSGIIVTKLAPTNAHGDAVGLATAVWEIKFTAQYSSRAMPLLAIDPTNLSGGPIKVEETTKGGGTTAVQKVTISNAHGGFFTLNVIIDKITYTTAPIQWDVIAEELELILQSLSPFSLPNDVKVVDARIGHDPSITGAFQVTFDRRFGAVPLMTVVDNHLLCVPVEFDAVAPPPYPYRLEDCGAPPPSCSSAPPLCHPIPEDDFDPSGPCCEPNTIRDSANMYNEIILQRDLFDPNYRTTPGGKNSGNRLTIKNLAVLKGLNPAKYNPYKRDFVSGILTPINYSDVVETKMSVVLIGTDLDTKSARERISRKLKVTIATAIAGRGVLPARMVWEVVPTGGQD